MGCEPENPLNMPMLYSGGIDEKPSKFRRLVFTSIGQFLYFFIDSYNYYYAHCFMSCYLAIHTYIIFVSIINS